MFKKVDCDINTWVANWMLESYDWIIDATACCEENYGVDDINLSATTKNGDIIGRCVEVKSLKGGYSFKYEDDFGDEWNNWFSTNNPNGIIKKMKFGNVPPHYMDILDAPYEWEPDMYAVVDDSIPEELKNKHIYILNAEDKCHRIHNSKAFKVLNSNASLVYVASDGLILFSPSTLRKAILGYAWFQNKSHTEEYNKELKPVWELKMLIDLEKGAYHKVDIPQYLLNKKLN